MERTNIHLAAHQRKTLDRLAAEEGTSRAALIRRLLDRALHEGHDDVAGDLAAIDGSAGALADLDALERGSDERAVDLDRVWRLAEIVKAPRPGADPTGECLARPVE